MERLISTGRYRILRRGVTLIESVLFTTIALSLIVGGVTFFQQASTSQRISESVRSISAMASETRAAFLTDASFTGSATESASLNALLINVGGIPENLITGASGIRNEWGGTYTVSGHGDTFSIAMSSVPRSACSRLTPFRDTGSGTVGNRIASVQIDADAATGTADTDGMTSADSATACGTTNTITWVFER